MLRAMARRRMTLGGLALAAIMLGYAVLVWTGLDWGLPARADDRYLFPAGAWSGERIAGAASARADAAVGADVDRDPLITAGEPVTLNATEEGAAAILRRYRLFTRQPDEMITIMALSGMQPGSLRLDPKLYQYGGLFIYPVGALIGLCGALGVYPVAGDLDHYLEHPEDIGKFYITARGYAAAWGVVGIVAMFGIGRRIGGTAAGLLAALLFALLPVVTCMAHEAKPHLPGAVLMLLACLFAMRALDLQRAREWAGLFICCGAAVGMVLSSAPIVLLIPLAIGLHCRNQTLRLRHEFPACSRHQVDYRPVFVRATLGGWLVAGAVYLLTNPYIVINLATNRAVLRSNFGNSLAMYEVSRLMEGAVRVVQLTVEGATWPVAVLGVAGGAWAVHRRRMVALPLGAAAVLFALQFVAMGAGKPDEYGRFGVFTNCALAVSAAAVIAGVGTRLRGSAVALGVLTAGACALGSGGYLAGFAADARRAGSRDLAAEYLATKHAGKPIAVAAEPAPYGCPPLAFSQSPIVLYRLSAEKTAVDAVRRWNDGLHAADPQTPLVMVATVDDPAALVAAVENGAWDRVQVFEARWRWLGRAAISWANKPVVVLERDFHRM